jgi:hypothetical protein
VILLRRDLGMQPRPPRRRGERHRTEAMVARRREANFYNTRDVYRYRVMSGHCPAGTTEKVNRWPMPEVPNNIDTTVGNLGLTDHEEDQIVTFMKLLPMGTRYRIPIGTRLPASA